MDCKNSRLAAFFDLPRKDSKAIKHKAYVLLDAGAATDIIEQLNDLVEEFGNVEVKPIQVTS